MFRSVKQPLLIVLMTLCFLAIGAVLFFARWIWLSLLVGIGLGVLFIPVMEFFRKKLHLPHALGILLILVLLLALGGSTIYLAYDVISAQVIPLVAKAPQYLAQANSKFASLLNRFPSLQRNLSPRPFINGSTSKEAASTAASTVFKGLQFGATALGGSFFIIATALYVSSSPGSYLVGFQSLFPRHMRSRIGMILGQSAGVLRHWFVSQLLAMSIVGVVVSLGLKIIGSNSWYQLGALTAALELIPFIGPIGAFGAALLVTLASQPEKALWVGGFFLVMLRVEGDLIIPLLMRGRIDLPPVHLLTLMLLLGDAFGVLGFLVAAPLLAVSRKIYLMAYVPRMDARFEETPLGESQQRPKAA